MCADDWKVLPFCWWICCRHDRRGGYRYSIRQLCVCMYVCPSCLPGTSKPFIRSLTRSTVPFPPRKLRTICVQGNLKNLSTTPTVNFA